MRHARGQKDKVCQGQETEPTGKEPVATNGNQLVKTAEMTSTEETKGPPDGARRRDQNQDEAKGVRNQVHGLRLGGTTEVQQLEVTPLTLVSHHPSDPDVKQPNGALQSRTSHE